MSRNHYRYRNRFRLCSRNRYRNRVIAVARRNGIRYRVSAIAILIAIASAILTYIAYEYVFM